MSNLPSLFCDKSTWEVMKEQSATLVKSGVLPSWIAGRPEAVIAIVLKGYELRLPPMQSLGQLFFVNGRLGMAAELMLALIYRDCPNAVVIFESMTNEGCVIKAARTLNSPLSTFNFTFKDAERAKLTGKDNWKNYPRAMCKARTISEMARTLFPEVLMGCSYTHEELEAIDVVATEVKSAIESVPVLPEREMLLEEMKLGICIMQPSAIREKIASYIATAESNPNTPIEEIRGARARAQQVFEAELNTPNKK